MPANRSLAGLGLVLATVAALTSLPGGARLPHHRIALHATIYAQLDDDEDREVLPMLAEGEERDEDDEPDPWDAA